MKRHLENLTIRATRAIEHWWLLMLAGIFSIGVGVAVFVFPLESYLTMSIILGVLMIVVGTSHLLVASTSDNYLMKRGYMITGGVIDIVLGIVLCVYPEVSIMGLPIVLGLWLLYHSFITIAFGGDMETFNIHGGTTVIAIGILILLLAISVLINPFTTGVATIIIIAGTGLVMLGIVLCIISVILKDIDKQRSEA